MSYTFIIYIKINKCHAQQDLFLYMCSLVCSLNESSFNVTTEESLQALLPLPFLEGLKPSKYCNLKISSKSESRTIFQGCTHICQGILLTFLLKKQGDVWRQSWFQKRHCRAVLQNVLERIHPLQFESLWGKLSSHVVVVLYVRRDEHGDWSSSHEHFDVVALCGKVTSERSSSPLYRWGTLIHECTFTN